MNNPEKIRNITGITTQGSFSINLLIRLEKNFRKKAISSNFLSLVYTY
jgi:hypothetical protein